MGRYQVEIPDINWGHAYIDSINAAYFVATLCRFTLSEAVSSPPFTENAAGATRKVLIDSTARAPRSPDRPPTAAPN